MISTCPQLVDGRTNDLLSSGQRPREAVAGNHSTSKFVRRDRHGRDSQLLASAPSPRSASWIPPGAACARLSQLSPRAAVTLTAFMPVVFKDVKTRKRIKS